MRGDLLSGGAPKRLIQASGHWSMEVVRQVAIDRSVYRPHSQLLEGPELIVGYLKRNPSFRGLADSAVQLLQTLSADASRSFDAVNGEWVPSPLAPDHLETLKRQQQQKARRSQYVQLVEMRTQHVALKRAHDTLKKRVDALTEMVERLSAELEVIRQHGVTPVGGAMVSQGAAPAAAPSLAEAAPEQVQAAPQEASQPAGPRVKLPGSTDFIRCLEQLIGGDATAVEHSEPVDVVGGSNLYAATLVDDADALVGAVIMDLKSTVYLGGTLLMVPHNELEGQVANHSPSEDSIAASAEVCNSLSGSLNNVAGNTHVRANFLEPLSDEVINWYKTASHSVTLRDNFGGLLTIATS